MSYRVELVYNTLTYNSHPVVQPLMVAKVTDLIAKIRLIYCIYFLR